MENFPNCNGIFERIKRFVSSISVMVALFMLFVNFVSAQQGEGGLIWNQGKRQGPTVSQEVAHVFGIALSTANFKTKYWVYSASDASYIQKGFHGISFYYHLVRPERTIYFSPTILYSYSDRDDTWHYRYYSYYPDTGWVDYSEKYKTFNRYFFLAANAGLNASELAQFRLPVDLFLEGGGGTFILENSTTFEGRTESVWHFLLLGFDIVGGARYWISPDFGLEGSFRYINCFLDFGLDSNSSDAKVTFWDLKFGIGIVWKP